MDIHLFVPFKVNVKLSNGTVIIFVPVFSPIIFTDSGKEKKALVSPAIFPLVVIYPTRKGGSSDRLFCVCSVIPIK